MQEIDNTTEPAAWRINNWRRQVANMSRTKFYEEREAGRIETVKLGSATLVTTPPRAYIAALRQTTAQAA
jgi:hypothetical protein